MIIFVTKSLYFEGVGENLVMWDFTRDTLVRNY